MIHGARPSVPVVVGGNTGCTAISVACTMSAIPWSPICTSAIIHDSLARPCRRCDAHDVMQPFNCLPLRHTLSHLPPRRITTHYRWPL